MRGSASGGVSGTFLLFAIEIVLGCLKVRGGITEARCRVREESLLCEPDPEDVPTCTRRD